MRSDAGSAAGALLRPVSSGVFPGVCGAKCDEPQPSFGGEAGAVGADFWSRWEMRVAFVLT